MKEKARVDDTVGQEVDNRKKSDYTDARYTNAVCLS